MKGNVLIVNITLSSTQLLGIEDEGFIKPFGEGRHELLLDGVSSVTRALQPMKEDDSYVHVVSVCVHKQREFTLT